MLALTERSSKKLRSFICHLSYELHGKNLSSESVTNYLVTDLRSSIPPEEREIIHDFPIL